MRALFVGTALVLTLLVGYSVSADESVGARTEQKIPYKRTDESTAAGLALRIAGALVVTILVGIGVVYAMKRFLPTIYRPTASGDARIHVVEVRRLTAKTTLFLVHVDGTPLLLAQSGEGVSLLHQLPVPDEIARDAAGR